MSDQPKPTTGEWTDRYVYDLALPYDEVLLDACQQIADAHNAALVAAWKEHDDVASAPTGQRLAVASEWTVETNTGSNEMKRIMCGEQKVIGWTMRPYSESFQMIADAHNAALVAAKKITLLERDEAYLELHQQLAAERERLRLANIDALQSEAELNDLRIARDDESKLIRKLSDDVMQLSQQLAVEREKCGSHGGKASRGWADKDHIQKTFEADQLHEQLAAEREKLARMEMELLRSNAKIAEKATQLAAERESWVTNGLNAVAGKEREIAALDHEIQQLREQLAAAQATIKKAHFRFRPAQGDTTALDAAIETAVEEARAQWRTHKDFQRELAEEQQPLVDALERLRSAKGIYASEYWRKDACNLIDAALAKVVK